MEFKTTILASTQKVWETLWNDVTYRQWTAAFSNGSRAETDWKKGSKVLFVDDQNSGLVAIIEDVIPNELMSVRYIGLIANGKEDLDSANSKQWAGAYEQYRLQPADGKTELTVHLFGTPIPKEFESYFLKTWPEALKRLKEMSETGNQTAVAGLQLSVCIGVMYDSNGIYDITLYYGNGSGLLDAGILQ